MYDTFISYASADLAFAERLYGRLRDEGFSVWFDRVRLQPGYDWHRHIEAACEDSRVMLAVMTPRWKLSDWTKYETYGAEMVVPLIAEGRFDAVVTPPIRRFQAHALDFTHEQVAQWDHLFAALRELLARPQIDPGERARRMAQLRYRPSAHFVGRERELETIHEQLFVSPSASLTRGQVQVIAALGGVGKTTLARMYAEKFWRCYRQIFWVDARAGYEAEFARVRDLLLPEEAHASLRDARDADKARRALKELEQLSIPRLLIIDDARDEESAAAWIPKTGDVHTIVTSRFAHWEAIPACHIYVLDPGPARQLLLERSGRTALVTIEAEELVACDELARTLGPSACWTVSPSSSTWPS